ncbi:hypothetical protein [Oceanibaculum indicum]|uniref:Uncharacterized protein n=1 Tax=Oceanibaculum indicum P24 TaxID=1207063 RepID=K2J0P7_9PROT|nr:hypothetical protein [Oceanibaculum indicum]EKE68387.1 hypothetical protein P24_17665 [Oceanibaculum indicum P24]
MLGIARAFACEIFTLESGRLLASLGLAGAVGCGVVLGWTEYGDTARNIGALTGVALGLAWKIRKAVMRISGQEATQDQSMPLP